MKISKKGKVLLNRRKQEGAAAAPAAHNKEKNYILKEGTIIPPLVDLGIFTPDGRVVKSMYDKYRQINRFIEIVDDAVSSMEEGKELTIVDFGCGKSYLTFILYYYFVELRHLPVKMIGLDLKADVIEHCNQVAQKYGYERLSFQMGRHQRLPLRGCHRHGHHSPCLRHRNRFCAVQCNSVGHKDDLLRALLSA